MGGPAAPSLAGPERARKDRAKNENECTHRRALQGVALGGAAQEPRAADPGRLHPSGRRGHLLPADPRQAGGRQNREDHPPGDGPHRRAGGPLPGGAAPGAVGRVGPLRERGQRAAALYRPHRPRDAFGDDPRGGGRPPGPHRGEELPEIPLYDLPDPDQVPRRGPAPGRADPGAGVHHEGRLLLPHQLGGLGEILLPLSRGL